MCMLVEESVKIAETMLMYSYFQREAKNLCFPTAQMSGSTLKGDKITKI